MNYKRIHDELITNAKSQNRCKSKGVYELHHIKMKSLGGDDSEENTVLLTPKEHYIVHLLLWKENKNYIYLAPLLFFKNKGSVNSRIFSILREEHINHMKINNPATRLSPESSLSKSKKLKNRIFSDDHRKKLSESKRGKATRTGAVLSEDQKNRTSQSLKKYFENNEVGEETRRKISEANTGKRHSEESLQKQKQAALNRPRYDCIICRKSYDAGNMTQHMRKIHNIEWKKDTQ